MLVVHMYASYIKRTNKLLYYFLFQGFHVHAIPVSEGSPNCTAAGGHFNPYSKSKNIKIQTRNFFSLDTSHGPRTNNIADRHVGDLGNITTNVNGTVNLNIDDSIIQLYNATQSIINLTAIVHLSRDDAGKGGFADSHTTGYDCVLFF